MSYYTYTVPIASVTEKQIHLSVDAIIYYL